MLPNVTALDGGSQPRNRSILVYTTIGKSPHTEKKLKAGRETLVLYLKNYVSLRLVILEIKQSIRSTNCLFRSINKRD